MTDHNLQDFFTAAAGHRLSAGEKEHIYHRLQGTVTAHPRGTGYQGSFLWQGLSGLFRSWTPIAAVLVILVLTGAGAVLAEDALPGDFFYPVKRITERVRTSISVTAESRANVETKHLGRRLDEAAELETKGKLTESAAVELDTAYKRERTEVEKTILQLEAKGNASAAADVRTKVDQNEKRYERLLRKAVKRSDEVLPSAASSEGTGLDTEVKADVEFDVDEKVKKKIDVNIDIR